MRLSQNQILERAEGLASSLAGGPARVEKNVLLAVVADFMSDRQPDLQKLRRTLQLLGEGSGGHLKRSGGYAGQIRAVVAEVTRFLGAEELEPEDHKSVFGWTARLLLVRGLPAGLPPAPGVSDPQAGRAGRDPRLKGSPKLSAPPSQLGSVDKKSLSALQKLKQDIEEREKRDKG